MADLKIQVTTLSSEDRLGYLQINIETEYILMCLPQADDCQRSEHKGQNKPHAILIVNRRKK